jgi:hypothetical protein
MLFFALVFFKIISTDDSGRTAQQMSAFDANFRLSCLANAKQSFRATYGIPEQSSNVAFFEQECECALSEVKRTGSVQTAVAVCAQLNSGQLRAVSQELTKFYSGASTDNENNEGQGFRVVGGGFALFMGILCFVCGLLGWLLVMKKRVLQCSICGAVINAS